MTDIIVVLTIATLGVLLYIFLRRRKAKEVTPGDAEAPTSYQYRDRTYYPHVSTQRNYCPETVVVQSNSGFNDGLILGAMLNNHQTDTVVVETPVYVSDPSPSYSEAPVFHGFGGGDSAGGGASSSWDSSSSSDYSSSSSDSSSYDSSSSSCDSGSSSSSDW